MRTLTQWRAVVVAIALTVPIPFASANVPCNADDIRTGDCPSPNASITKDGVDLYASDNRNSPGSGSGARTVPPPLTKSQMTPEQRFAYETRLQQEASDRNRVYRPDFWVEYVGTPPTNVTIDDIASFAPAVGGNHMEPNGWIVVGLDTNFHSDVSTRVVDGTLLGLPASVRFTPLSWHWAYGDGAVKNSASPGASWAALKLAEFAPTATSHVFANPGTYAIDLTIEYSAEYRFGANDWVPIAGTIDLPTNRIVATAGDATTVLVARDCRDNPGGPGC